MAHTHTRFAICRIGEKDLGDDPIFDTEEEAEEALASLEETCDEDEDMSDYEVREIEIPVPAGSTAALYEIEVGDYLVAGVAGDPDCDGGQIMAIDASGEVADVEWWVGAGRTQCELGLDDVAIYTHRDVAEADLDERRAGIREYAPGDPEIRAAIDLIGAWADGDGWRYHASETREIYEITIEDLADLAALMSDPDPTIAGDAYSHWCAGGHGTLVFEEGEDAASDR